MEKWQKKVTEIAQGVSPCCTVYNEIDPDFVSIEVAGNRITRMLKTLRERMDLTLYEVVNYNEKSCDNRYWIGVHVKNPKPSIERGTVG